MRFSISSTILLLSASTGVFGIAAPNLDKVGSDIANAATDLANAATDVANAATSLINDDNVASITSALNSKASDIAGAASSKASEISAGFSSLTANYAAYASSFSSKYATYDGWDKFTSGLENAGASVTNYLATQTAIPTNVAQSFYSDVASAASPTPTGNAADRGQKVVVAGVVGAVGFVAGVLAL